MTATAPAITWTRQAAGHYHAEVPALGLFYTVARFGRVWAIYHGALELVDIEAAEPAAITRLLATAKATAATLASAHQADERYPVGALVWDASVCAYARVAKPTTQLSPAVLVEYLPGSAMPAGEVWAIKADTIPQAAADAPQAQPNASQADPLGFQPVAVGVSRSLVPGVLVTPLQAIGWTVTYRATTDQPEGTAWRAFLRCLPDGATVDAGRACWSETFPYAVREVQPA